MEQFDQHCLRIDRHLPRTSKVFTALGIVLFVLGIALPQSSQLTAADAQQTSLSRYKERKLSQVDLGSTEQRWESYKAIDDVFSRLWLKPVSRTALKEAEFDTFKGYPNLQLEDRDGDGKAEFFAYLPPNKSSRTQEFGAFFDLNGDGRTDWIVFYGGFLFDKKMKQSLWHHHSIDTNGDGNFDIRIYRAIDVDGDGFPEEEATTWVYDPDHDGLVDKAELIIGGRVTPIEPENGALNLHYILNTDPAQQLRIGGPMPTALFKDMANDIDGLSTR